MTNGNEQAKMQWRSFKRLLHYGSPFKKQLSVAFLLLIVATAGQLVGPYIVKVFIDDYLTLNYFPTQPLVMFAIFYMGAHLISIVADYFQLYIFQSVALKIIHELRIDVFEHVHKLGLKYFDSKPTGGLVSRITNDTEAIKELFVSVLSTFIKNIVFLIGVFIAMFLLNVKLAFFTLALLPIIVGLTMTYRHFSSIFFHSQRERLSELNAKMSESLQGMAIVQIFHQEKRLRKEFEQINDKHYDAGLKGIKLDGLLLRPAVDLIYIFTIIMVLSFFGFQSFDYAVEIGVIYAFVNYLERFFEPVNQMMMRLSIFQQAIVASTRVFQLLDEDDYAPQFNKKESKEIEKGEISFQNVSFSYEGENDVLKNISFTAKPSETIAIVGHTGSGKSSIINLLMNFYNGARGQITIDGKPLSEYNEKSYRSQVGLVLQDAFLFAGTVEENIKMYGNDITKEDVVRASKFVQVHEMIEGLPNNYDFEVNEGGSTFSSGQRQLISFARTMVLNPKILVLDEATANIDTETEEKIQTALKAMRRGRTTIAIAHRLSTIQDADEIIVLHKGEIVERGTHESLISQRGHYYHMYLMQQGNSDELLKQVQI
ncbi:ABC transporter ATP-binding protein [Bacillus solimangrovi]|uniref:Multidrug ABC transporter ATP-binding protein n=1 Tax=Bacillus solimangrovi TaxID=1305675 RepID=A0A1E5LJ08_9BACI|nr:ABC transporter ATP-binding protein [Bacillus solimangrovi]OEH94064.1 multidrug ABC transporter ATP-binding protein [Bacillus solimangrovi]